MKAAVFYGIEDIKIEDIDIPSLLNNDVLLKPYYCGICGSDLGAWNYGMYAPGVVIGHEFSAEVVDMGPKVTEWKKGDRVVANSVIPCKKCEFCNEGKYNLCNDMDMPGISMNGGLAERVVMPSDALVPIPESVSAQDAALAEPLSVVLHGVSKVHLTPGQTVLTAGAGTIGLLAAQVARISGASFVAVSEINPFRLELAQKMGFYGINPLESNTSVEFEKVAGNLPDCVIECTGVAQAASETFSLVKKGGTVLVLGLSEEVVEADFMTALLNELKYQWSYLGYSELPLALTLIAQKLVDTHSLITDVITLDEIVEKGFKELVSPTSENVKILVKIDGGD